MTNRQGFVPTEESVTALFAASRPDAAAIFTYDDMRVMINAAAALRARLASAEAVVEAARETYAAREWTDQLTQLDCERRGVPPDAWAVPGDEMNTMGARLAAHDARYPRGATRKDGG